VLSGSAGLMISRLDALLQKDQTSAQVDQQTVGTIENR